MKIQFNNSTPATPKVEWEAGRYIATVTQIANVGLQKAYDPTNPPQPSLGIAVHVEGKGTLSRIITVNCNFGSHLHGLIAAALGLDTEDHEGREFDLNNVLGKPLAVEVELTGRGYPKITGFAPLEEFETAPKCTAEVLALFDVDNVTEAGKASFTKLDSFIRSAISKRVREAK